MSKASQKTAAKGTTIETEGKVSVGRPKSVLHAYKRAREGLWLESDYCIT